MAHPLFVGDLIRALRKKKGLAQFDLARLSGVAAAKITAAERRGVLDRETAERFAPVLGVAAEVLLRRAERYGGRA